MKYLTKRPRRGAESHHRGTLSFEPGEDAVRLAIWSTTTPREDSTRVEMFQCQLEEVELAERTGIVHMVFRAGGGIWCSVAYGIG
jgi:hypothetical protein